MRGTRDAAGAAPALAQQPRLRIRGQHRLVRLARLPRERRVAALVPSAERPARRERIDQPLHGELALVLAMLAPVVQHVAQRIPRLAWRRDDLLVVAVGEHGALAATVDPFARLRIPPPRPLRQLARLPPARGARTAGRDRDVDTARGADLKCLHPAREGHPIVRLDQQVQMVALDAEVHDPAVRALADRERGPADRAIDIGVADPTELLGDAERDEHRLRRLELGPDLVALARTATLGRAAQLHAATALACVRIAAPLPVLVAEVQRLLHVAFARAAHAV